MPKMTRDKQKLVLFNELEIKLLDRVLSASGFVPYSEWVRTHLKQDAKEMGIDIQELMKEELKMNS